jgi:hypothetical protein
MRNYPNPRLENPAEAVRPAAVEYCKTRDALGVSLAELFANPDEQVIKKTDTEEYILGACYLLDEAKISLSDFLKTVPIKQDRTA